MSVRSYRVLIHHKNGSVCEGHLLMGNVTPNLEHRVHLTLHAFGRKIQSHDRDYFAALAAIRRELEKDDLVLACWGASRNVSVSAACEEETFGLVGCRLTLGRPVMPSDYVNIFESGEGIEPDSVEAQRLFHREWLISLGWEFDGDGKTRAKTIRYNPYKPPVWVQVRWRLSDMLASLRRKPMVPTQG